MNQVHLLGIIHSAVQVGTLFLQVRQFFFSHKTIWARESPDYYYLHFTKGKKLKSRTVNYLSKITQRSPDSKPGTVARKLLLQLPSLRRQMLD